jgi:hypothetical protein
MSLRRLNPPLEQESGDISLIVDAATSQDDGDVYASVSAYNGDLLHVDTIHLARASERGRFVNAVLAAYPQADRGALAVALLEMSRTLPTTLAQRQAARARPADDPPIATTVADDEAAALPWIDADVENLRIVTRQAWNALKQANGAAPSFFRFGGLPARLERDDDGNLVPTELGADRMRHVLARVANWYVDREAGLENVGMIRKVVKPPTDVVRDVLATPEPPLPTLRRLVEAPVFAPDGTLQTEPGYHAASCTYYQPRPGFTLKSVPSSPSADDVSKARRLFVEDVLRDFPFVADADRAHAVALWLLPFARDLIRGPTPMHVIEAPIEGSGKGLLADVCLSPANGHRFGTLAAGRDDPEWRKCVTSALREGHSVLWIDNIVRPVDSPTLAAALTALVWEDRILGESKTVRIPVRCTWVMTGNNPILSGEMTRRSVRIRIDPRTDRPWLREDFQHADLRAFVREKRADLVWAALTLIRAWLANGKPTTDVAPLGSYEDWTRVIGGILAVAGVPGFLGNIGEFYQSANTEAATWRAFVAAWWQKHQAAPVTTREILPLAVTFEELDVTGKDERAQATSLGKKLRRQRDRVIGDYRLLVVGEEHHAQKWALQHVAGPEEPSPPSPSSPGVDPARHDGGEGPGRMGDAGEDRREHSSPFHAAPGKAGACGGEGGEGCPNPASDAEVF